MTKHNKVKVKVVDVGRSSGPEYAYFEEQELSRFRATVVTVLARNFIPTDDELVKTVLEGTLALHYWRRELTFEQAVEQVVRDIKKAVGQG